MHLAHESANGLQGESCGHGPGPHAEGTLASTTGKVNMLQPISGFDDWQQSIEPTQPVFPSSNCQRTQFQSALVPRGNGKSLIKLLDGA